MNNIKNKSAIVTGGANGIGFKYVEELLRNGAKCVAILDLLSSNGDEAAEKLGNEFGKHRVIFLVCDVTNPEQLRDCFKRVIDSLKSLDILINNAGILNDKNYEQMININYTALVRCTLLGLEFMGKQNKKLGGTIINIGSIAGLYPSKISPIYVGTKHAVVGFSRSLKDHYETTGVRVLVMCPGVTNTPLINDSINKFMDIVDKNKVFAALTSLEQQSAEHVAKAMMELIERGENGDVWVSEDSEPPYAVDLPHYSTLKLAN